MSISDPQHVNVYNPGISAPFTFGNNLARPTSIASPINQIRGIAANGSTGAGIPRHVTALSAAISNASKGATSTVSVSFRRDPSDLNFGGVNVYVKGYQGNNSFVKIAGGSDSPVTVTLNNTGEAVSFATQATGNSGSAPLSTAPTTGAKLPKSALGGFGTTTVTTITNTGSSSVTALSGFIGPGWEPVKAVFGLGTQANGSLGVAANTVYVWKFDLLGSVLISTIVCRSTYTGTSHNAVFGIYDVNKNKVLDSGAIAFASSGLKSTSITPVTLQPGTYFFAQSVDNTAITAYSLNLVSYDWADMLNLAVVPFVSTAANTMSGTVLPSTLGALTADSTSGLQPGFVLMTT
jgi:hypothetical protein